MERIEYDVSMGKITLTEEQAAILKSLPFEEQVKRFKVEIEEVDWDIVYGERIVNGVSTTVVEVEECKYARKWIVKEGIIVGATFNNEYDKLRHCLLGESCWTYYHQIRNGIGGHHFNIQCRLVWQ